MVLDKEMIKINLKQKGLIKMTNNTTVTIINAGSPHFKMVEKVTSKINLLKEEIIQTTKEATQQIAYKIDLNKTNFDYHKYNKKQVLPRGTNTSEKEGNEMTVQYNKDASYLKTEKGLVLIANNLQELKVKIRRNEISFPLRVWHELVNEDLNYYCEHGWFGGFCSDMYRYGILVQPTREYFDYENNQ